MKTELKNIGACGGMHYDFFTGANGHLADMERNACDMFDSSAR